MSVFAAAIDFGTTYSGYAFSVSHPSTRLRNVQILSNQAWNSGIQETISLKTPTCLLLTKDKQIVAFGYEAENQYSDIVMDEAEDNYYFFDRFKMRLHNNKNITMNMIIDDVRGQPLPALDVFSLSIKALKDHLKQTVEVKNVRLDDSDTQWILTVPAIWTDTAKLFMRKAAEMAGISEDRLTLALEPEAASIYCQTFTSAGTKCINDVGSKYLVVDLGGGTIDITAHEKLPNGTLKELARASGNDCGGTSVDQKFLNMMDDIFGRQLFDKFKSQYPDSYLNLIRRFESLKRTITHTKYGLVNITIPNIPLDNLCKSELGRTLEEVVSLSSLTSSVTLYNDKLRIDSSFAKLFFEKTTESIVSLLRYVLSESAVNISNILLVGGFAESVLVQNAIKQAFPEQIVVVPEEPSLAVLKGAVLFVYNPESISSRVTRYTYGVEIIREFDIYSDDCNRKIYKDGSMFCKNIFHTFMSAKQSIPVGMKVRQTYTTSKEYQSAHYLPIYYTDKQDVQFTDEGTCIKLGEIEVEIPNPSRHLRELNVVFCFGKTELTVMAHDKETGEKCKTSFKIQDFEDI